MPMIDSPVSVAVLIIVFLGSCLAVLMSMWDRTYLPFRRTVRWVKCPRYLRPVRVEFIERVQPGMAIRKVDHCPLRIAGERCGEGCLWEPTITPS